MWRAKKDRLAIIAAKTQFKEKSARTHAASTELEKVVKLKKKSQ